MIRVMLADDHAILRESLALALTASGDCCVVAEAADGIAAIEQAHASQPHVAIIDISMPRLSGMEVARRIGVELPRTRVLVLTMHEEEEYVMQLVRVGAAGYLLKQSPTKVLLEAVRALASGGVYFGQYAAQVLAWRVREPQRVPEDPYGRLSSREREVLHLVVNGLTTKEIAKRLAISVKTAENHRCRVLDKLNLHNSAELVRYAMHKRLVE